MHLCPDLDDAAVVGDELLRRHAEGGVAHDRLDAPAVSVLHTHILVTLFAQNISCVMSPVQPGEDEDSARTLGT